MDRRTSYVAIAVALAASIGSPALASDPALRDGDPVRWSIPADTPAQKHEVAVKEAGAALGEALKECRALHPAGNDRKSCEAAARQQWQHELREARRVLSNDSPTTR